MLRALDRQRRKLAGLQVECIHFTDLKTQEFHPRLTVFIGGIQRGELVGKLAPVREGIGRSNRNVDQATEVVEQGTLHVAASE